MGQPASACQISANIGITSIKYKDYYGFTGKKPLGMHGQNCVFPIWHFFMGITAIGEKKMHKMTGKFFVQVLMPTCTLKFLHVKQNILRKNRKCGIIHKTKTRRSEFNPHLCGPKRAIRKVLYLNHVV